MTNIPAELKYTASDEWLKVEGDEALVGITDYAQNALSDLVYIELPSVGASFKAGESFATVESVKAQSGVNMPVSGTVLAVNSDLESAPEKINENPYGAGWLVRIKLGNAAEVASLMDAAAYTKHCEERG